MRPTLASAKSVISRSFGRLTVTSVSQLSSFVPRSTLKVQAALDEDCVQATSGEVRLLDHGLQERQVRSHAADAELRERAPRPGRPPSESFGLGE